MRDNPAMHLLIAHAAPPGPQCQAAIPRLQLPHLAALLKAMQPAPPRTSNPSAMTPLYEHIQADLASMDAGDGLIPWAALDARRAGLVNAANASSGWAWITPCHWRIQADHVEMQDPGALALTAEESAALMEAMRGYFAEDGITLHALRPDTWLAEGAVLKDLPTTSLGRARGARVDRWMPRQPQAKPLRRLQNEMQMLLYTHPINDARQAAGQTTINSFWVSGTGELPATYPLNTTLDTMQPICTLNNSLRDAALADDASAWLTAWHTLDATGLANAKGIEQLTLCGENQALTLARQPVPWWRGLQRRFIAPTPAQLIAAL